MNRSVNLFLCGVTLCVASCNREQPGRTGTAAEQPAEQYAADNTGQNVRDKDNTSLTPLDQSEKKDDVRITQEIRKWTHENDALSGDARNVKIITVDGVVTLRGPVLTQQERSSLVKKAQDTPGVIKVADQLEVKNTQTR